MFCRYRECPRRASPPGPAALLLVAAMLALASCGGGGGGDSDTDSGIAWVTISSTSLTADSDGGADARLAGKAFVSPSYVAHKCAGLACLFTLYDDSYPGVDVSWDNLTSGLHGTADSRYGNLTDWEHLWSATIPVMTGINRLRITASDPAGNSAPEEVSVDYVPPAPTDLRADTGDSRVTLLWTPVAGATGYRVYWSDLAGLAFSNGTAVDVDTPPWVHSELANGTTRYYAVTSRYLDRESPPSAEIAATAGAPAQPQQLVATLVNADIRLSWQPVTGADTYTLYWRNEPGVDPGNGTAIAAVFSPWLHTGLAGMPYYYVLTAVNAYGESLASAEVNAFPPLPPPVPTGLTATQRSGLISALATVDLQWNPVPGASAYDIYRCQAWTIATPDTECEPAPPPNACFTFWEHIGTSGPDTLYVDFNVDYLAYWYYLTAFNGYGTSPPSEWSGLCVRP
jgi:hypothetical protein